MCPTEHQKCKKPLNYELLRRRVTPSEREIPERITPWVMPTGVSYFRNFRTPQPLPYTESTPTNSATQKGTCGTFR
jgi:hypothetical protein